MKFSKNLIKSLAIESHAELLLDFDLCLIDRVRNEAIMQLFAIFTLSDNNGPVNDWKYVQQAVDFGRSLITDKIKELWLRDLSGIEIIVPVFSLTPQTVNC